MATVNLDALLPREDFEVTKADVHNWQHSLTLKIEELEAKKITYNTLCKPDFQRETASWDSAKIVDLISSYLNGDLIPAIILWRSQAGKIFVIDGAHRLSALIAWVQDDYGDKEKSLRFFQNQIPSEQLNAAKRTRQAIESSIGTYVQHTRAFEHPETTRTDIMDRARRMASLALQLQWVPDSDPQKAEDSFFKINQSAQAIEPTELRILRSRDAPNALAARVIVRSATGHQYWRRFPDAVKPKIESSGRSIFKILFEPEIDTPIKNLNLPFAGRSGQSLSHIFDLVNLANDVPVIDSTKKQATLKIKDDTRPPPDVDGTQTSEFLHRTQKLAERMVGTQPASLGLDPAVYVYGKTGRHQPTAFLGIAAFIKELDKSKRLREFLKIRSKMEEFLLDNRIFITQIVTKRGSGAKGLPLIKHYYLRVMEMLASNLEGKQIVDGLRRDPLLSFLSAIEPDDAQIETLNSGSFSRDTKSAAYIREALSTPLRCALCGGRMQSKSISIDHIRDIKHGGLSMPVNAQLTHPYCNSIKDQLLSAAE